MAMLLHVSHPHPKVLTLTLPSGHTFNRVLLISPAGPVKTSADSMTSNNGKDELTVDLISILWAMIEANHDPEVELVNPWLTPTLDMHETWYENWPVGEITITIGEDEILRDDILQVANILKVETHLYNYSLAFVNN